MNFENDLLSYSVQDIWTNEQKTRRTRRLSDKDTQPNSSYSFERLVPFHAPAIESADWYCILSIPSIIMERDWPRELTFNGSWYTTSW